MNHPFKVDEFFMKQAIAWGLKQIVQFRFGDKIDIHYCNFHNVDYYTFQENIISVWHIKPKL